MPIRHERDQATNSIRPSRSSSPIDLARPGRLQFARTAARSIRATFCAPSRLDIGDPAPLGRQFRRRADRRAWCARGYPLMRAHFPRCFVDVNREPYELDPRMFDGRLPSFANTRSMRVAGGLGTVARVVGDAQEIYDQRIPVDDAIRARSRACTKPYHRALRRLFTRVHRDFGAAVLIDCHSMPSTAGHQGRASPPRMSSSATAMAPAASARSLETVEQTLRGMGYTVSRNKPYAGGFITEHYGNPAAGLHAIQLEINRALYMDERRYRARSASFGRLAADLETLARTAWARSLWRSCGPIARRRRNKRLPVHGNRRFPSRTPTKKGPLREASGPSLGRKRPRRAAVTRGATASQ